MGKIAFVFSGQGAQYTGMGKELYECSPAAKAVFDMADSIRQGTSAQCFEADKETLSITVNTQPCVFTADLAAAAAVAEKGIKPDYLAGFSL
ncbi:MAG: ACP S-malonyltransferase, partial [Clostridia bacterium]|nr:ACP S-malonyltransferase [Clostridia bacterium]